ncbi:MAG TPA: hypothetical protein VIG88_10980, partial [Lysobacter sp.]
MFRTNPADVPARSTAGLRRPSTSTSVARHGSGRGPAHALLLIGLGLALPVLGACAGPADA